MKKIMGTVEYYLYDIYTARKAQDKKREEKLLNGLSKIGMDKTTVDVLINELKGGWEKE